MYVKQLAALTEYLAGARREVDEICRFLVLNTLQGLNPRSIYLAEIEPGGSIFRRSSFGLEASQIDQWERIPLNIHVPLTDAINRNRCIVLRTQNEFLEKYPAVESRGELDLDWTSAIATPILPYGAFFLLLRGEPKTDSEFEPFLRSVGYLLALSLRQTTEMNITAEEKGTRKKSSQIELTPRQEVIVELLSKGFTNNEISKEIGFSESLIRQETVAIYAFMGVSGRKELIRKIDSQAIKA